MADKLDKPASVSTVAGDKGDDGSTVKPVTASAGKKGMKMGWQIWVIGGAVVFVLVALVLVRFVGRDRVGGNQGGQGTPAPLIPTATTIPTPVIPEIQVGDPTVYSNDPQVLQLEGALKNFERQLDEVDYREQDLDPPGLLMDVNFKIPR